MVGRWILFILKIHHLAIPSVHSGQPQTDPYLFLLVAHWGQLTDESHDNEEMLKRLDVVFEKCWNP